MNVPSRSAPLDTFYSLRCISKPFLDPFRYHIPNCKRYNCPLPWHGWEERRHRADQHILALPQTPPPMVTFPIHLNSRLTGKQLGAARKIIKQVLRRHAPLTRGTFFNHVKGSCRDGLPPYPHVQALLLAADYPNDRWNEIRERVESALCHNHPDVNVRPFEHVNSVVAKLRYLYQADADHWLMPEEELPRSRDFYTQRSRFLWP